MDSQVRVFIEIEQGSNIKYEFDKEQNKLIVDRILPDPFFYPYAYGFIPNTLAKDGDDLDVLILTNKQLKNNKYYNVYIVGVLNMEDEQGMDEKILCVLEEDSIKIQNITDLDKSILDKIHCFFSNYKNNTNGKWSKVIGYSDKNNALDLYKKSIIQ
jgi:inorganic pyrophosphatase